jgi:hypothetical protein
MCDIILGADRQIGSFFLQYFQLTLCGFLFVCLVNDLIQ